MKLNLLVISAILFSFSINAQIDFEAHIIVDSHPDVLGPYAIVSADIDGDGDKDIVATSTNGDKLVWFENLDGLGNFSEPIIIASSMDYPMDLAVADIDGDGDLDLIAVSNNDGKIVWFANTDGLGTFGPQRLIANFPYVQTVQVKDIDGDGHLDIIAGGNFKVIWLKNLDGLGTFGPERIITNTVFSTESIEVIDIDGDGDLDVVVADGGDWIISWYENLDGQGNFGPARVITSNLIGAETVATIDIDNDGDLDIVSSFEGDYIAWFENTDGLGNFGPLNIIDADIGYAYKVYVEDLDSDGYDDIIASIWDRGEIIWLKNDGIGNFGLPQVIYSDEFLPIPVVGDDLNGNGKMDLAAGIYGSNQIIWFENKGPLGVEESIFNLFNIYPNPSNGLLNIKSNTSISEITVYNNLGQLLLTSEEKNQVDISALSEGIYYLKIKAGNGQTETKKVIKK